MPRSKIPRPLRLLAGTALTGLAVAVGVLAALSFEGVATAFTRQVLGRVAPDGVVLRVGGVPRLGLRGLTATDVVFLDPTRGIEARLDTVSADYRVLSWRRGRIVVSHLDLVGLAVAVDAAGPEEGSGETRDRPPEGEPWRVVVEEVDLRTPGVQDPPDPSSEQAGSSAAASTFRVGRVAGAIRELRLSPDLGARSWALELAFAPSGRPGGWGALSARGSWQGGALSLDTLSLLSPRSRVAGRIRVPLDGAWSRPGGLEWRLDASPLDLGDLEGLLPVPAVLAGDSLTLASWSEAAGDSAAVHLDARTTAGASLTTDFRWGRQGSRIGFRGEARVAELDLRRYLGEGIPVGSTSGTAALAGRADWVNGSVPSLESSLDLDLAALEGRLEAEGRFRRGVDPSGGPTDSLELRIRDLRWRRQVEVDGELEAVRTPEGVEWIADLRPRQGGRLFSTGGLTRWGADGGPRWDAAVRFDAVPEPRTGSVITGRVRGVGAGSAPSTLDVALAPSVIGGRSLDTVVVGWAQGSGDPSGTEVPGPSSGATPGGGLPDGRIQGRAQGDFGALHLDADLSVGVDGGRLRIRSLELDSVGWPGATRVAAEPDGRQLPGAGQKGEDPGVPAWAASRLSGRGDGELAWDGPVAEAADPVRWSGGVTAVLRAVAVPGPVPVADSIRLALRLDSGLVEGRLEGGLPGAGHASVAISGALAPPLELRVTDGRFQALDLSAFLPSAPATRLEGRVRAEVRGGAAERGRPTVRGRIELDPSTVGEGRVQSLSAELLLGPERVRGDVFADLAGGTLRARLDAPDGWREGGIRETPWRLEADGALPELGAFFGLPDTAVAVTARLEAGSDPRSGTRIDLALSRARGWGARIDTAVVRGGLGGSLLTVDTILVRSNVGAADGGGALPRAVLGLPGTIPPAPDPVPTPLGSSRLALTLSVPDSARTLRIGTGSRFEVAGGGADLSAECRSDQCDLRGDVELATVLLGRWSVLAFQAGLRGSVGPGRRFGPTRTGVVAESIRTPRLDVRTATFQTQWNGTDLEVVGTAVVDDRRAAAAELRIDPGARSLAFERLDLRFDEDEWSLERPVTFRSDTSGISLDSLVLTSEPQRVLARLGEEDGARFFSLEADSLRLGAFSDLLGRPALGGVASGQLRARGAEEGLVLLGDLTAEITSEGLPSHRIEARAEARRGDFTGDLRIRDPAGSAHVTGHAEGRVPGVGEGGWTGTLEFDEVPLGWAGVYAPPEWVRNATGSLQGRLAFEGGPGGLVANGPLRIDGGRVQVPRAAIVLDDIQVDASVDGRSLRLTSAGATSRGRMSVEGSLSLPADEAVPEIDLRARADDFLASNTREIELAVSGEAAVEGPLDLPRIEGRVEVVQGSYRIPAVLGRQVREVTLTDEDWAVLQSRFGIAPPEDEEGPGWLPRSAALDLDITLGRDIWLRRDANPELALQFTGDLRLRKSAQDEQLQLQGSIESIPGRSYVEEFGRRFTVEEGRVELRGPPDQTRLAAVAEYEVPTSPDEDPVTIRLDVTGWIDDLELAVSSEPSLSNGDIVSYLATGRPASSAFSGNGSAGIGADILASALSGSLEQFAQQEAGLDVLQIQQEGLQGTSLVAGKYVNPRLFLGFRQGVTFVADDGSSFTEGLTSQAEVEYAALNWLVVNVQGGTSAIRFFLEGTYGW